MGMGLEKMNLAKEPTGREKVLFLVSLVVVLFLFMNMLWKPLSKEIVLLKTDLGNTELQLEAVQRLIDATTQQLAKSKSEPSGGPIIDPYVKKVVDRHVVDVTDEINTTADLMGGRQLAKKLTVIGVDVGQRAESHGFTVVPIKVDVSGRYSPMREYLEALENIGRPLVVKTVSATKGDAKGGLLEVKLEAELYLPKM